MRSRKRWIASITGVLSGAIAAFEEDDKGSLEPGKLADIVVWSHDFMQCDTNHILAAQPVHTIVGGRILFSAEKLQ